MTIDEFYMASALSEARRGESAGEVPVGALVLLDQRIIATAFNRPIGLCDPTAHAEILAIREASRLIGNYRLTGATLYVTLEPCAMCAGALINSRISRLVFGAFDSRAGAVASVFRIADNSFLNHRVDVTAGVLATECRELLQAFFQARRARAREHGRGDTTPEPGSGGVTPEPT
ncbi:MAG: tRNA adenosine(34) deaminase TadA [Blastocatellia bacterium]